MRTKQKDVRKSFLDTCKEYSLLDTDSVLVAFSGGADSVVLLFLLDEACKAKGIKLAALHINHMIRGEEADRDEEFCKNFCLERGIPFFSKKIDIPSIAKNQKSGIEETARNERYKALQVCAENQGFSRIATAHNSTDNLETLIFNLARGMSVHGAGGIAPRRDNIIRPLIEVSKDDILEFAKENNLSFVVDSTNCDTTYTRNFIRHKIIPSFKKINPNAESAAIGFSKTAREDDRYLLEEAEKYRKISSVAALASLDDAILKRVLLLKSAEKVKTDLTKSNLDTAVSFIKTNKSNPNYEGQISLPNKLALTISCGNIAFVEDVRAKKADNKSDFSVLLKDGENLFGNTEYRIVLSNKQFDRTEKNSDSHFIFAIEKSKIKGELIARTRREKDTIRQGNMTKKVKKMLCDFNIPKNERASIPFICDEVGIIAVYGLPKSDRVTNQIGENCIFVKIYKA